MAPQKEEWLTNKKKDDTYLKQHIAGFKVISCRSDKKDLLLNHYFELRRPSFEKTPKSIPETKKYNT